MAVSDPLRDPRLTVDHAKSHIDEVKVLAKSFFESNPHTIVTKPDGTHHWYYVKLVKPLPLRISGLALDAVKNLRSALDQLGFAVAVAAGRPGGHAHFPFGESAAEVERRRTHRSKHIRKEIFDLMAAFKPYKGGNETLWRLNKLSNVNKHENFIRAACFTRQITYESRGATVLVTQPHGTGMEDIFPVAMIPYGSQPPYDNLNLDTTIRFNDVDGVVFKEPAIELLDNFFRIVNRIIVAVEREGRRLALFEYDPFSHRPTP